MGPPAHLKPKHKGKALLAGAISGVVEICITYPIEYTKTMQQLATTKMSPIQVVQNTLRQSGPSGMYRGLSSMVYAAGPKAGVRFMGFEQVNSMLPNSLGPLKGFFAGLGAGVLEAVFVTTPQETIKVKLIDDQFRSEKPRFNGFFHGVRTIVAENGLSGCYRGLAPTIFKVATAQATRFGLFNLIPTEYRSTPASSAAAGAFAGLASVLLFHPVDVVKSRMQGLDAGRYRGALDCLRQVAAEGGAAALYKGAGPRSARVMCEVAITMTLYGEVVRALNSVWHTDVAVAAPLGDKQKKIA
uniref:Uncharacterized protein n=1 Tax=Heterosigma akashiwo TaxID=2829 RepID=A0A6V3A8C4_HETAK|mmetsp:Transcript_12069/g.16751  ORF Transcript_12069/g.16751 Transcript_12069/m.16751 type:complete len:300 (-) Transcript_12069:496-1395(-)